MKKTLQRLGIVTVGLSLCLWSCDKQDKNVQPSEDVIAKELSQNEHFTRMEEVAKALAKSMGDKQVRSFIKTEASKQMDGDYDILYNWVDDKMIVGKSLESIIVDNTATSPLAKTNALKNLRVTATSIPLLNISVPVNIDKWDTENFEPLVAVSPYSFKDEKDVTFIKAYDKQGNVHWLDAKKKPDFPVIAVGVNERSEVKNGNIELKPIILSKKQSLKGTDNKNQIPFKADVTKLNAGARIASSTYWPYSEYSDNVYLNGVTDGGGWLDYEGWLMGDPEIQVFAFIKDNSGNVTTAGSSYHDINDDYYWHYTELNQFFGSYNTDNYPEVYFGIWEDDSNGTSREVPVAAGITYNVSANDNLIGERFIDRRYYPGWTWWVGYVHQWNSNSNFFIKASPFIGRTDK
jgi:Protein of unknown function (DUF3103)